MDDSANLQRDLEMLADALPFLVARDDDRPPMWMSPEFGRQVAAARVHVATIASHRRLATRMRLVEAPDAVEPRESGRFEAAARRLAHDATCVALAIRCVELRANAHLPSWTEILRRRTLAVTPVDPGRDGSLWFG